MALRAGGGSSRKVGIALVVTSALGFASIGPLGKVAYRDGFTVAELQLLRFSAAAPVLVAVAAALRRTERKAGARRSLGAGTRLRLLALGFVGYGVQATLFFTALTRISASLTSLLLYLYPALVAASAVALGRHRLDRATAGGLVLILGGTVLVLGLPGGPTDALGVALGLGSAVWYTGYLLGGERVAANVDALVVATHVAVGAALWFACGVLALRPDLADDGAEGIAAGVAMAILGTAVPIAALFGGMARLGVTWASIGSALEPVATVALAVAFLGEDLGVGTVVGGTAVVAGAVVLPLVAVRTATDLPPPSPESLVGGATI